MYVGKKKLFKIHQAPSSTAELKSQNKKLCAHQARKQSHSWKVPPQAIKSPSELGVDAEGMPNKSSLSGARQKRLPGGLDRRVELNNLLIRRVNS